MKLKKRTVLIIICCILIVILIPKFLNDSSPKEENQQIDFVKQLEEYNLKSEPLKAQIIGDRTLWIYQPIANEKYVGHFFEKNKNDDFILYSSAVIGYMENNIFFPEQYLMAGSNKEFAFRARPSNLEENSLIWFPEHENIGSAFANSQSISFDDIQQNSDSPGEIVDVESVRISQNIDYIYPSPSVKLANLNLITEINSKGVHYTGEGTWLENTFIERGYVAMLPTINPPMHILETSFKKYYELKKNEGKTDIKDSEKIFSYIYKNDPSDTNKDFLTLAQTINSIEKTLRTDQKGTRQPSIVWLEHRSNGEVQKLYPQIYDNYTTTSNEKFGFNVTIFAGFLPNE